MKRKVFFLLVSILLSQSVFSQTDSSFYNISYNVEHVTNIIDSKDTSTQTKINYSAYLMIGSSFSKFLSKNQYYQDSMGLVYKESIQNTGDIIIKRSQSQRKRVTAFESLAIYTNFRQNMYNETAVIGISRFLMYDSLKEINWQLKNVYKEILGYKCQQAQALFKCRNWIVWFSNELPVSSGPWKLNGLPGLILEASDDQRDVLFIATEILKNGNQKIIELPQAGYTKCTRKEFYKLLSAYAENPFGFIKNQTGFDIFGGQTPLSSAPPKLKVPNNPIERCSN